MAESYNNRMTLSTIQPFSGNQYSEIGPQDSTSQYKPIPSNNTQQISNTQFYPHSQFQPGVTETQLVPFKKGSNT